MRLGRIGFDRVVGYLHDGLRSLDSRPELIARTERVGPAVAAERLASDAPPLVVDVRAPHEYEAKHIDGSFSMPLNHLEQLADRLPSDRPLLVHCAGGYRSSIAVSLLRRMGFNDLTELAGGITAWEAAGLSVSRLAA
jgi:rhodanese-related sulfurtransferase